MLKEMMALAKSKGKDKLKPMEKEAKMGVLKEIKDMAAGEMSKDLHGLKKVTVAAPDSEGLKTGLEKAEELVEGAEPASEESSEDEEEKHPAGIDVDALSEEEREELLKALQAKKLTAVE